MNAYELRLSELANERDAARFLGISLMCLRTWRNRRPPRGPEALTVGSAVFYEIAGLKKWVATTPSHRTLKGYHRYEFPDEAHRMPEPSLFDALGASIDTRVSADRVAGTGENDPMAEREEKS